MACILIAIKQNRRNIMTIAQSAKRFIDKRYEALAKTQCNTCNVGTWVIGREQHLYNQRGFTLKGFMSTFRPKGRKATSARPEQAKTTVATPCSDSGRPGCKILVVCKGAMFSQTVMDYAVEMAAKTNSGLVALNLNEKGLDFNGFCSEAEKNISAFSCKAADAGLRFSHQVKQGAETSVVAELHQEDAELRYVMDDVASSNTQKSTIPVYTRATLRAR